MSEHHRDPRMAWDRLEPPQRAGDVAQRRPLTVLPLRRLAVDELQIVDDDLPQADGATLVWLEREGHRGWTAWAARLDADRATPWLVSAARLHLVDPDPSLLRLIGPPLACTVVEGNPRLLEPMPRQLSCICREKTAASAYRAAESGWVTVDAVKRRTGALFGECQGRRCEALVGSWLDLPPGDPLAAMTPRPPLVPVPASLLAAFADG